jgi:hypothetical protein
MMMAGREDLETDLGSKPQSQPSISHIYSFDFKVSEGKDKGNAEKWI